MVYGIPSYLVYLLATKIAVCYVASITLVFLNNGRLNCWHVRYPGLTFGWLPLKSYFHPYFGYYVNHLAPLVLASNYYLESKTCKIYSNN